MSWDIDTANNINCLGRNDTGFCKQNESLLCWQSKNNQKEFPCSISHLLVVWVSWERKEGIPQGWPFPASSREEQSRFVNQCRGGLGRASPLPTQTMIKKGSASQQRFSGISSPASSHLIHSVMPQSNVYDLIADHHARSTKLRLLRNKTRAEMLDSLGWA